MELLREFAHVWLRRTALPLGHANGLVLNRRGIAQLERAHPGFADQLRQAALDAVEGAEPALQRRAVAALAVVGTPADIPALRRAGQRAGAPLAQEARTAVDAIEAAPAPPN
jgi:hypothetical protein